MKLLRANHKFPTREAVGLLRSEAAKIIKEIEGRALDLCQQALGLLEQTGVEIKYLSNGASGVFSPVLACQRQRGNIFDSGHKLLVDKAYIRDFIDAPPDKPFTKLVPKGTNAAGREQARALEARLSPIVEELRTTLRTSEPIVSVRHRST